MTEHQVLNTSPLPVRLTVGDYLMLDESGAFADYNKTELIDGEVLFMNAQHRAHARIKSRLFFRVTEALRSIDAPMEAMVEGSVRIPPHNVPEPDIVITSEPEGTGLIPIESVRLVIEVADSTLSHDLGRKAAMYARNDVPEYWVVDVEGLVVHQAWTPGPGGYDDRRVVALGETITAMTIHGLKVDTRGV